MHTVATIPTASGPVGYILFNDHIATAEQQLIDAVNQLQPQNIVDLLASGPAGSVDCVIQDFTFEK